MSRFFSVDLRRCKPFAVRGRAAFPRSVTVEWRTPAGLFDALNQEFHFDMDPCPAVESNLACLERNGLAPLFTRWHGKRVFCNCPYGPQIQRWLERGLEADLAVFLIPARTDTRWFHEIVLPLAKEIRFLRGRLRFGDANAGAPFPSMVVVFEKSCTSPGSVA